MLYYIFTFAISLFAIHLANKCYNSKALFVLFSFIAVAPPILLAGLRADTVGSDTDFYILPRFQDAVRYKVANFSQFRNYTQNQEILYALVTYLCGKLTSNQSVYLIILHTLVIIPLYFSAFKWRDRISPVFFFFIFYMTFYNDSLSIIRQSISISFAILAFCYFIDHKYIKFIAFTIISCGFHNSGYISLMLTLLYLLNNRYSVKLYKFIYLTILIFVGISVTYLNNILLYVIEGGLIDVKYLVYTSMDDTFKSGIGATNFVLKIYFLILMYIVTFKRKSNNLIQYFFIISCVELMLCLCALVVEPLDRLSLYPRVLSCIYLPYIYRNSIVTFPKHGLTRVYSNLIYIILFVFWWWVYMHGDYAATSNYHFM